MAALAAGQDLRLISGMPSWLVILLERVARARRASGRPIRHLGQCWPNLRVLIHGGVAFAPYASVLDAWSCSPLERVEVYPASEGFVAVQTEATGGLTLMLDYGIFYEFVPVEDLSSDSPRRHTVADVELNRSYALVMSTPGGLWSYVLGDTVRFTRRDPLRLVITGRTRHYVNAFGENVIVEEIERALVGACRRTEAEVVEFTVAPSYPGAGGAAGRPRVARRVPDPSAGARGVRAHHRRDADRAERRLPDEAGGRRGHDRPGRHRAARRDLPPVDAGRRQARRPAQGTPRHQ